MSADLIQINPIQQQQYPEFKKKVIFQCCKWDPQVGDVNAISDHIVVISKDISQRLIQWAESLSKETLALENQLIKNPNLWNELSLPGPIKKALKKANGCLPEKVINIMRFDFHPTATGWALTEVNRDVPGGFSEASTLPQIACSYINGQPPFQEDVTTVLCRCLKEVSSSEKLVALVHCTSYSDDRQVMEYIAQQAVKYKLNCIFISPDHIKWENGVVKSIAEGQEGEICAIVRFFPAEWLRLLPSSCKWQEFFAPTIVAANHATAILTQSKRLPLVWDKLNCEITNWKNLLPPTYDPRNFKSGDKYEYIFKPAFGRVGEGIGIHEVLSKNEIRSIEKSVRWAPKEWIIQRRFTPRHLVDSRGIVQYLCIGVFTVNSKACGFYGRISDRPRIDSYAKDVAIIVEK